VTGAVVLGCAGPVLGADEAAFFRSADPWGFILFARNVETPAQLARLAADLRAAVGRDVPVFTDQEGGRVQRLRSPHWREWAPPLDTVQAAGPAAARAMYLRFRLIAVELHAAGIDGNCAPTVDIATVGTHPFLRNRCYGNDVETVVAVSRAVAQGLLDGGVLPVMKHVPGHGRATLDTHLALPTVTESFDVLMATDFAAFRALSDLPIAMSAHVVFSALDVLPATCSAAVMQMVRRDIGFDGLMLSDDLSMEALSGSLADRAAAARAAGCDIALYCKGVMVEAEAVVAAAGSLDPEGAARAAAALAFRRPPLEVDIAALEAELSALSGGMGHG
jgi:beta-N-acetylhexosaminidase